MCHTHVHVHAHTHTTPMFIRPRAYGKSTHNSAVRQLPKRTHKHTHTHPDTRTLWLVQYYTTWHCASAGGQNNTLYCAAGRMKIPSGVFKKSWQIKVHHVPIVYHSTDNKSKNSFSSYSPCPYLVLSIRITSPLLINAIPTRRRLLNTDPKSDTTLFKHSYAA